MTIPSLESIASFLTIFAAVFGALLAALWLSLIIWAFRDMRHRSRDPFAQILAALLVALLPFIGIIIYLILRPPETLAEAYERALEEEALLQEIEERPSCPGCSRTIDANWILCPHCHTRLKKACPDCNSLMDLQWTLCPFCGNQHIDPYRADLIKASEIEDGEETAVSTSPTQDISTSSTQDISTSSTQDISTSSIQDISTSSIQDDSESSLNDDSPVTSEPTPPEPVSESIAESELETETKASSTEA